MARVPAVIVVILCLADAGRTHRKDYGYHSNNVEGTIIYFTIFETLCNGIFVHRVH